MASLLEIIVRAKDEASAVINKISGTTADAGGRMQAAGAATARFGQAASSAVIPLAAAGFAINSFSKAAADVAEAQNKASVVFGQSQGTIDAFAKTSASSFGLSRRAALEYTGTLGTILQAGGLAQDATAGMSVELVKLASDLASFNNIPIDQALEKIRSGLVGETEPLRTVGVLLSAAAVQEKAYQLGLAATGAELTEQQKVQARYALILEQTEKAQGDFARTSGGLANQQRIVSAQFENLRADVGTKLVPVLLKLLGIWNKLPGEVQVAIVIFAGFGLLIAPAVIAIGTMISALIALVPAILAVGASMVVATGGLILLVPALIAIGVAVYVFRDQIMDVFNTVLNFIQGHQTQIAAIIAILFPFAIPLLLAYKFRDEIKAIFDAVVGFVRNHQEQIAIILALLAGPFLIAAFVVFKFRDDLMGAFNTVKAGAADVVSFITGVFSGLGSVLSDPFRTARDWVKVLWEWVHRLIDAISDIHFPDLTPGFNLPGIGGIFKAMGGPVSAGMSYIVGEKGPELFVPKMAGSIIPNRALPMASPVLAGAGNGGDIHIHIHTMYADLTPGQAERFGKAIRQQLGGQLRK